MATVVEDKQKNQDDQKNELKEMQERPLPQIEEPTLSLDELIKQMINHHIGFDALA